MSFTAYPLAAQTSDTNSPPTTSPIDIPGAPGTPGTPGTNAPVVTPVFKWRMHVPKKPFLGTPEQRSIVELALRRIKYTKSLAVVKMGLEEIKKLPENINLVNYPELVESIVDVLKLPATELTPLDGPVRRLAAELIGLLGAVNFVSSDIVEILDGKTSYLGELALETFVEKHHSTFSPDIMDYLVSHEKVDLVVQIARRTSDSETISYITWYAQNHDRMDLLFGIDDIEATELAMVFFKKRLEYFTDHKAEDPIKPFVDMISKIQILVEDEAQLSVAQTLVDTVDKVSSPQAAVEAAKALNSQFTRDLFDDDPEFTALGIKTIEVMQKREKEIKTNFTIGPAEQNRLSELMKGYWKGLEKIFYDPPKQKDPAAK